MLAFNTDVINAENIEKFNRIAEMYFRFDIGQMEHLKFQYHFSGLLGDIGGSAELLTKMTSFILGGYLSFHSSIEIMKELYSHSHQE